MKEKGRRKNKEKMRRKEYGKWGNPRRGKKQNIERKEQGKERDNNVEKYLEKWVKMRGS